MAEWWMTAEGARTIGLIGDFAKRGVAFMLGVEALLRRIATALENRVEEEVDDEPPPHALFSTATKVMYAEGIWNETLPGYFHFAPKYGLYLNGTVVHLEAIEVDEGAMGIQKAKHRDNEKEYDTLLNLCDGAPSTIQIVGNAGGGFRKVVPFVVPGEK